MFYLMTHSTHFILRFYGSMLRYTELRSSRSECDMHQYKLGVKTAVVLIGGNLLFILILSTIASILKYLWCTVVMQLQDVYFQKSNCSCHH